MNAEIRFDPITDRDLDRLSTWFVDHELARRIDPPTPDWLTHVASEGVIGRVAWVDEQPAAVVQCDVAADGSGSIALWIEPGRRGKQVGRSVLRAFLALSETARLRRIDAFIDPDNQAAMRCFAACGFSRDGADADGFTRFSLTPALPAE